MSWFVRKLTYSSSIFRLCRRTSSVIRTLPSSMQPPESLWTRTSSSWFPGTIMSSVTRAASSISSSTCTRRICKKRVCEREARQGLHHLFFRRIREVGLRVHVRKRGFLLLMFSSVVVRDKLVVVVQYIPSRCPNSLRVLLGYQPVYTSSLYSWNTFSMHSSFCTCNWVSVGVSSRQISRSTHTIRLIWSTPQNLWTLA